MNITFSHRSVLIKRQKSAIICLKDAVGNLVTDKTELYNLIRTSYMDLYTTEKLLSSRNPFRTCPDKISLTHPPSDQEIRQAMCSIRPLKAPVSDEFHPIFFQKE